MLLKRFNGVQESSFGANAVLNSDQQSHNCSHTSLCCREVMASGYTVTGTLSVLTALISMRSCVFVVLGQREMVTPPQAWTRRGWRLVCHDEP